MQMVHVHSKLLRMLQAMYAEKAGQRRSEGQAHAQQYGGYLLMTGLVNDLVAGAKINRVALTNDPWAGTDLSEQLAEKYRATLRSWFVVDLDAETAESAARLRAALKLKLADAVQAASALAIGADALSPTTAIFLRFEICVSHRRRERRLPKLTGWVLTPLQLPVASFLPRTAPGRRQRRKDACVTC
jgi:hypothetical protein